MSVTARNTLGPCIFETLTATCVCACVCEREREGGGNLGQSVCVSGCRKVCVVSA